MKKILLLIATVALIGQAFATDHFATPHYMGALGDNPAHQEYKWYGFYGILDGAFIMNLNKDHFQYTDSYQLMGMTAIAGFQWRKESAIGLGLTYLQDPNGSFSQIPVFVEFRSHFLRSRLTPYSAIQFGYTLPLGTANSGAEYVKLTEGGLTFGCEIGGRLAITRKIGIHMGVGYQLLQAKEVTRGFQDQSITELPELYHNLKASIGLSF